MRVLALVTLPTLGASNRLRIEQYAGPLREMGIDLEVSAFFDDAAYRVLYSPGALAGKALGVLAGLARRWRDLRRLERFDVVVVHRESSPLGPPIMERALVRRGRPYVFDFDDALFLRPVHPTNRRWAWLRDPGALPYAVAHATRVIAGNEYLAEWARRSNERVEVIPTPVDTSRHVPRPPHRDTRPFVIGWVGSSTTAPYLRLLDEPLERLARMGLDLRVRVIGGGYDHPSVRVESLPYSLEREARDIASFDVGVLPEPDDPWTRGKGAFKGLLYMATAVPVIASRIGVNPDVIVHGETGFCVDDADGWVDAIVRCYEDATLRQSVGDQGRARVERLYSVDVQVRRFAEVLRSAAAS